MIDTFEVAPLVEIVVEVKWIDPSTINVPGGGFGLTQQSSLVDEFYMRFGGVAYSKGFQRAERLVPPGFPVPMGAVVYRYKPAEDFHDPLARSALWQLGPGVFSANAIPPYKSWSEFSPWVQLGLETLIETRPEAQKASQFNSVSLRYIDAFTENFYAGQTASQFLKEKLGFEIKMPMSYSEKLRSNSEIEEVIQFAMPLDNAMTLNFAATNGKVNGSDALIVQMNVSCDSPIDCDLNQVMAKLNSARTIIHDLFIDMTRNVHQVMKPLMKE
jgi:uncharacterized protein (TIGR04255 family)